MKTILTIILLFAFSNYAPAQSKDSTKQTWFNFINYVIRDKRHGHALIDQVYPETLPEITERIAN